MSGGFVLSSPPVPPLAFSNDSLITVLAASVRILGPYFVLRPGCSATMPRQQWHSEMNGKGYLPIGWSRRFDAEISSRKVGFRNELPEVNEFFAICTFGIVADAMGGEGGEGKAPTELGTRWAYYQGSHLITLTDLYVYGT